MYFPSAGTASDCIALKNRIGKKIYRFIEKTGKSNLRAILTRKPIESEVDSHEA